MDIILIAFLAYTLGAVFRTIYDFLWKKMQDETITFDSKYWITMVISIILSIISAMVTFTTITVPADSATMVFMLCLTTGFMMNHLVNKPITYLSTKKG